MDCFTRIITLISLCSLCFLMRPLPAMTQAEFTGLPLKQRRAVVLDIARQQAAGRDETVWALNDGDLTVRTLALDILGELPDLRAATRLAAMLTDPRDWVPIWRVRKALLSLGHPAVMPLVEQMKTVKNEANNRLTITNMLVDLNDPAAVPPLFDFVAEEGRRTHDLNSDTSRCQDALIALNPDPVLAVLEHPDDPFWYHASILLPEHFTAGQQARLVAALRNALSAQDRQVRYRACVMLGKYDPAATDLLLDALKDPWLCTAALQGLHGRNTPAVTAAILPLLQTREADTLSSALYALEGARQPELVDALFPLLNLQPRICDDALDLLVDQDDPRALPAVLHNYNPKRNYSVKIVRYLGEKKAKAAITVLIPLLGEEEVYWFSTERAKAAVDALARIGAPAYQPLVEALESPDREERMMAARALGKLGNPAAISVLRKRWNDPCWQVYENAARAIGMLGDPGVDYLLAALKDPDPKVRGLAACGLGASDAPRVIDPLLRCLTDSSEVVQAYASWSLVNRNDLRIMEALALHANCYTNELAENDEIIHMGVPHDWNMLQAFAEAYAHFGKAAIPVLQQALRNPKADREFTTVLLSFIKDDDAIPVMIGILANPSHELSYRFIEHGAAAIPPLIRALHDPQPQVRRGAASTLVCLYFPQESAAAFPDLLEMVAKDRDPGCRMQAALALGNYQLPLLQFDPLRAALDDPQPVVRMAAALSAGRIGDVLAIDRLKAMLADQTPIDWGALYDTYGEINSNAQPQTVGDAAGMALSEIEGPQPDERTQ